MRIDAPAPGQLPALRELWKEVFRDPERFLDDFFSSAFSPRRCRCVTVDGSVAAALYWFDVECRGQKMAYLYAVATAPAFRNRGLCRALMEDTRRHMERERYQGILLSPESDGLARMYEKMGYRFCTAASEISCDAGAEAVPLRTIGLEEYARLRRELLPAGGVVQEKENLAFLQTQSGFFTGDRFLLSARVEEDGTLWGDELLGDPAAAPGILRALGLPRGSFRIPGGEKELAMFLPLTRDALPPAWFGLPFD